MYFLFLLFFALAHASHCTFIPPAGWEIAQLKNPSPHVQIGFIGQGSNEFRPSMNLATEEVDVSLNKYIQAVKELHLSNPTSQWRDLGKLQMKIGTGRLTELTNTNSWGTVKILQAFFVKEGIVYILTAAVLKEDFPRFQKELLQSFQSLSLVDELWTPISDEIKRTEFQSFFANLGTTDQKEAEWESLQNKVNAHAALGPYWQFLALKEGRAKIYATSK